MNGKNRYLENVAQTYALLLFLVIIFCTSCTNKGIVLENKFFRYEIDNQGKNLQFIDKSSGTDYLATEKNSICASVSQNGNDYNVSEVRFKGNNLFLNFKDPAVTVKIKVKKERDRITFTVSEVEGEVESLNFINIPLILEGMPYEPFAACALSMNLFTRVRELLHFKATYGLHVTKNLVLQVQK